MGRRKQNTLIKPLTKVKVSGLRRGSTISCKALTREEVAFKEMLDDSEYLSDQPVSRAECKCGVRPCPYVSCKYHLYLDVNPENGSIKFNFPDLEFDELEETCALDIIERGDSTLDLIGRYMNLTRERVRQIEATAIKKLLDRNEFPEEVFEFFRINVAENEED